MSQWRRVSALVALLTVLTCGCSASADPENVSLPPPRLTEPAQAERLALAWDTPNPAWSYTLLTDAWWANDSSVSYSRCNAVGLAHCELSGLVPSAPVTAVLVAVDTAKGVEAGRSDAVVFTAAERGACGALPDAQVWRDNREHLRADVTGCLESCSLSGSDCTEACVLRKTPFSTRCGACWSQYYDCAEAHCAVSCGFSPRSSKCHACTEAACTASGLSCTGMPAWAWSGGDERKQGGTDAGYDTA